MKTCTKCGKVKSLEKFYIDRAKMDGRGTACKVCTGARMRKYNARNREAGMARSRAWYAKNRERQCAKARADYAENRETRCEGSKAWRLANPAKVRAHHKNYRLRFPERKKAEGAVERAIKTGRLVRPDRCECCGEKGKMQAHHKSYARKRWLDVDWLLPSCHKKLHGALVRAVA